MMPALSPYGRPDFGRPVASSGSIERTAAATPSPRAWPSGRESLALVGWDSRFECSAVVIGSLWLQTATDAGEAAAVGIGVDPAGTATATSDIEPRASSGTVAESRTRLPLSMDGPPRSFPQRLRIVK